MKIDNEQFGLSDEELEALEDDEQEVEQEEEEQEESSKPAEEQEVEKENEEPVEQEEQEPPVEEKPKEVKEELHDEVIPFMPVADVTEIDSAIKEVRAQRAELKKKFNDGELEIEHDEYERQLDEFDDRLVDLRSERNKAQIFVEMNEGLKRQAWKMEVRNFIKEVKKEEGIDYLADEKLQAELDKMVRLLAKDDDAEGKPGHWFLEEAHAIVKARNGLVKKEEKKVPEKTAVEKAIDDRKKKLASTKVPQTLAHVPSAGDHNEEEGGEFAYLNKLSGMALERALAKLTPEQQEKYLYS